MLSTSDDKSSARVCVFTRQKLVIISREVEKVDQALAIHTIAKRNVLDMPPDQQSNEPFLANHESLLRTLYFHPLRIIYFREMNYSYST